MKEVLLGIGLLLMIAAVLCVLVYAWLYFMTMFFIVFCTIGLVA
jgi:hypothetical protein